MQCRCLFLLIQRRTGSPSASNIQPKSQDCYSSQVVNCQHTPCVIDLKQAAAPQVFSLKTHPQNKQKNQLKKKKVILLGCNKINLESQAVLL